MPWMHKVWGLERGTDLCSLAHVFFFVSSSFLFFQSCSLSVNTLTRHTLITSEADGFHSEGVMFLHSPVMGGLKNAMQHTHTRTCAHVRAMHFISTHIFLTRALSAYNSPNSGVGFVCVLEGSLCQEVMAVESLQQRLWRLVCVHAARAVPGLQRFESPRALS